MERLPKSHCARSVDSLAGRLAAGRGDAFNASQGNDGVTGGFKPHRDRLHLVGLFLALLALYLFTAPRTVVLEDDGLFILSSWFLGIEHPPGYPVYVLLGKLATLLPVGSPAWRVHALSGLFAALACVFVYLIARLLTPGRAPAWLAALGLGVSETFWSQALIADVYSLHALLFFALLYLALLERRTPTPSPQATRARALVSALLLGLGVANHWPLLMLSGPALLLLWLPSHRFLWRRLPLMLLLLALGLLPYVWMLWRSWQSPVISFQGPIKGWSDFWDYLLRSRYSGVDNSASADTADRLLFFAWLARLAGMQLLWPGGLLALIGAFMQWRRWGMLIAAAMSAAFMGPTLLLVGLLGFDYQPLQREAFRVYPVVAWGVLALWAGLGLRVVVDWLEPRWGPWLDRHVRRHLPWRPAGTWHGPIAATLTAGLLGATLTVHWGVNDRHADRLAHTFANAMLAEVAPNARLLLDGDISIPSTAYLHLIEGQRPDVTLVTESALVLEPRLFNPLSTPKVAQQAIIADYIAAPGGPVYRMRNDDMRSGTFSWLLFQVDRTSAPGDGAKNPDRILFRLAPAERAMLVWLASVDRFADGWNEMLRRALLKQFTDFQTRAELNGQWPGDDAVIEAIRIRLLDLPEAALTRASLLFAIDPISHATEIGQLIARFAAKADDPELSKRHLAAFYLLMARIAKRGGQLAAMREAVALSLQYWPDVKNPATTICQFQPVRVDPCSASPCCCSSAPSAGLAHCYTTCTPCSAIAR